MLTRLHTEPATSTWPGAHPIAARVSTLFACLLVLLALLAPDEFSRLTPGAFVSVPLEGLLWVALLLVLPRRATSAAATFVGVALGLLGILKLLDMGFFAVLARPFDPLLDWKLLDDAMRFLAGSIGAVPAIGSLAVAVALSTTLVIFMTRAVQHLSGLVVRHSSAAARAVVVLAVAWLTCAMLAIQIVPGVPIAVDASAAYLHSRAHPAVPVSRITSRLRPRPLLMPSRTPRQKISWPHCRAKTWSSLSSRVTAAMPSRIQNLPPKSVRARCRRSSTPCVPDSVPGAPSSPHQPRAAAAGSRTPPCFPAYGSITSSVTTT